MCCLFWRAQVLAYRFTYLTSVQLLSSFTIPCVFLLCALLPCILLSCALIQAA
jgi:hypothetical protein